MSKQARADVLMARVWWKRNLPPDIKMPLLEELQRARRQLETTPWAGGSVSDDALSTLRKLPLLRAQYHLFYEVDEVANEVVVLRVWHNSRGRAPKL